jgi:hypothetical protein
VGVDCWMRFSSATGVDPNIILAKIPQLSWWANNLKRLVHQDNCCKAASLMLGFTFAGLALNSAVIAPLAWTVLVLTLLNSYLGVTAKAAGGKRQYGGFLAKADRMIFLAAFSPVVLFFGPVAWNWLLLAFIPAILLTFIQRYCWIYTDLRTLEERKNRDKQALAD